MVPPAEDSSSDLLDVPAAVVCAHCGSPECPGCQVDPLRQTGSGLVFLIPWERSERGVWHRFWETSRVTSQEPETFFGALPDGPVTPALSYAFVAETVAVGSSLVGWGAVVFGTLVLAAPMLISEAQKHPSWLIRGLELAALLWATFTLLLVAVHMLHGVAIDRGAKALGAKSSGSQNLRRRAIRFGLYSTGWDVAASPAGFVMSWFMQGVVAFVHAARAATSVPRQSTEAFVKAAYRLSSTEAAKVHWRALIVVTVVAITAIFAFGVGLVAAWAY